MLRALANRFVSVALVFLLACISVLFVAAASTVVPSGGQQNPQTRAHLLLTLLR
jgi:ABC-type transporter Mla subunit MlaD